MARVIEGDEDAFVALIDMYRDRAVNIAYRYIGERASAEDIAQEAFVRIYETRERFDPSQDFSPWFYRILTNLCLDHLRREDRRGGHLRLVSDDEGPQQLPASETASPAEHVERQELSARVQSALKSLSDRQRMALVLQHYEALSYDEIAEAMGCSRGTVDGLLSRARATLRDRLSELLEK
ncbi:MAG: RNA polymerase sigma factor [Armatimonadota bacterium]